MPLRSRAFRVVPLVIAALLVCSASVWAQTGDDDAEQIKETLIAMWDAIEQEDLDAYARHLHDDFTAFGESDTYLATSKELEVRSYADYLSRVDGVHTEMHQPEVTVRGDVAWITYYWTDAGWANGERFTSRGKSTRIFVREDGRWLCIHGHYTAVP